MRQFSENSTTQPSSLRRHAYTVSCLPRASADSAERRAQKLAESFSGTRRRNVQQAKNNEATAAGDSVSKEKASFRIPAAKRSLVETKPTDCLPESEANVAAVPPEVGLFFATSFENRWRRHLFNSRRKLWRQNGRLKCPRAK